MTADQHAAHHHRPQVHRPRRKPHRCAYCYRRCPTRRQLCDFVCEDLAAREEAGDLVFVDRHARRLLQDPRLPAQVADQLRAVVVQCQALGVSLETARAGLRRAFRGLLLFAAVLWCGCAGSEIRPGPALLPAPLAPARWDWAGDNVRRVTADYGGSETRRAADLLAALAHAGPLRCAAFTLRVLDCSETGLGPGFVTHLVALVACGPVGV